MTIFKGTDGADSILRTSVSNGVEMFPVAVSGTLTGEENGIYGLGGDDIIKAGDGEGWGAGDQIYGGDGNDTITGGAGEDFLSGDAGDDTLIGVASTDGWGDSLDGGAGRDLLRAAEGYGNYLDGGTGADRMYGSSFDDVFIVENRGDKVIEAANGGLDTVVTGLATLKLAANVETLVYFDSLFATDMRFTGNDRDNAIYTGFGDDRVKGGAGDDYLDTASGSDVAWGGRGNDTIINYEGKARLYGGSGDDYLYGGFDADRLYGGKGADVFDFDDVTDSTPGRRDLIGSVDGIAFDGAGKAKGDLIDLADIDADQTLPDFQTLVFGGTGKGHLSVADEGGSSLVRANLDDDASFEFQILIDDGAVKASAYTADDFILTFA